LCDNQYDAEGIASLFTEDAVWESPALGRFEGREAIRNFFRGASSIFSFAIHYSLNGHIEIEGDQARARWYLFMPCTLAAGNQAVWRAGIDHETYARVDGTWMFRHKRFGAADERPIRNWLGQDAFRLIGVHRLSDPTRSTVDRMQKRENAT
jgi:ketosteroid isomerase-like protein